MSEDKIPRIIASLYALVDELQDLFPGRKFTPDGHLVGSIGEVVAKYFYDLDLTSPSAAYDAKTKENMIRTVQIKLTAGSSVALAVHDSDPDLLIVLHINRKLGFEEIYNGEFPCALLMTKIRTKRWVKTVSFTQLKRAQGARSLKDDGRIEKLNAFFKKEIE